MIDEADTAYDEARKEASRVWKQYQNGKVTASTYYEAVNRIETARLNLIRVKREANAIIHRYLQDARVGSELPMVADTTSPSRKKGFRPVSGGRAYADRDKIEREVQEAVDFFRTTASTKHLPNGHTERILVRTSGMGRAFWDTHVYLYAADNRTRWVVHEIAHGLEYRNPDAAKAVLQWRYGRVQNERTRPLRDLTGDKAYRKDEVGRIDQFFHPYVGKTYGDLTSEVFTMGVEWMFADPLALVDGDREHFDLIAAILTGRLDESPFAPDPSVHVSMYRY